LQYAHDRKIVHRDVKPENMLLGNKGELLLSDFGIAVTTTTSTSRETKATAGTVAYMAPEQVMGKAVFASDQYALGITVYEWLAGKQPFQGSFFEVCAQHLHAPVPSLREANADISPAVEQCILKTLAKEPEQRFASIKDFATALLEKSQLTLTSAIPEDYMPTQQLSSEQLPDFQSRQSGAQTRIELLQQGNSSSGSIAPVPDIAPTRAVSTLHPTAYAANSQASGIMPTQEVSTSQPTGYTPNSQTSNNYPQMTRPVGYSTTEPPFVPPIQPMQQGQSSSPFNNYQSMPMNALSEPRRRSNRGALIIACSVLLVLLILGSVLFVPSVSNAFGKMLTIKPNPTTPAHSGTTQHAATATQHNTHKSQKTAQQATPTQASQQTQQPVVRTITSTKTAYNTVDTTGTQTTNATQATGTISIVNRGGPLNLPAGTTLTNVKGCTSVGLTIQLDSAVSLASNEGDDPSTTVTIHVVQPGAAGNIQDCGGNPAFYYCNTIQGVCSSNLQWTATDLNGGFSGGTDAQTYTVVSQYDVDKTAEPLKDSTKQYALSDLQQ
jgi:serine/threonine protein kinase